MPTTTQKLHTESLAAIEAAIGLLDQMRLKPQGVPQDEIFATLKQLRLVRASLLAEVG